MMRSTLVSATSARKAHYNAAEATTENQDRKTAATWGIVPKIWISNCFTIDSVIVVILVAHIAIDNDNNAS